jgi:aspartyl protease family protein
MATRFMGRIIALLLLLAAGAAGAADVALIGLIGERAAVLAVDGGDPKTVKLGQTWNGITVLALEKNRATLEIDGRKRVLLHGPYYSLARAPSPQALVVRETATVLADDGAHFHAEASVNGMPVRFLVDTGASAVTLPANDARRLGIAYRSGARLVAQTANGPVPVYRVSLERLRVGAIELRSVEAVVVEHGLDIPLLGMSFLNQVDMRREGPTLTFTRRF